MLKLLVSSMFEYGNSPTMSTHASTLTMPNFSPCRHEFKKIPCWPRATHYLIYRNGFFMLELLVVFMFESRNPPIMSMHVSSVTMPNFSPCKHKFKKNQRWPIASH